MLVDGGAADHIVAQLEAKLELVIGQLQHLDRFGHDFRADAVTGENQNLFGHGGTSFGNSYKFQAASHK
ncbi:hypothetical protein FQZ97_1234510 [compost metagenome]